MKIISSFLAQHNNLSNKMMARQNHLSYNILHAIMSDSGGSTITTVRKQLRYTNVDYREMLSLCAQELAELRVL